MAMGTTRDDGSQQSMWVVPDDLPRSAGHPFYERLNRVLSAAGFDAYAELSIGVAMRSSGLCGVGLAARVNAGRYAKWYSA